MITSLEEYKGRRRDMLVHTAKARSHKAQAESYAWTARAASLEGDRERAAMYTRMSDDYEKFASQYSALAQSVAQQLEEARQAGVVELVTDATARIFR